MYTITFHSYRGGVGRTLALLNVAAELAQRGRKVLVVDFDLEAPALDGFEKFRPPQPHIGVVEYVAHYQLTGAVPDVNDYLYLADKVGAKGGEIRVMPARKRGDVESRIALARLDWIELYATHDGQQFFEWTKEAWEKAGFDYVLIDCRSGRTILEGICTRQLADSVVLFFSNRDDLEGLQETVREIQSEGERGRPSPIRLHYVLSNVPQSDEGEELLLSLDQAGQGLAAGIHRRDNVLLSRRPFVVLDRPKSRFAQEYRGLTDALVRDNLQDRDSAVRFLMDMERAPHRFLGHNEGDTVRLLEELLARFRQDPEVCVRIASLLSVAGLPTVALVHLDGLLENSPQASDALWLRHTLLRRLRRMDEAIGVLREYVRLPNLEGESRVRGLLELGALAPDDFQAALRLPAVQALDTVDRSSLVLGIASDNSLEVPPFLAEEVAGIKVFFDIAVNTAVEDTASTLMELLMERGYEEAIRLAEARGLSELNAEAVFHLAMAYWGARNERRPDLFDLVIQRESREEAAPDLMPAETCQMLAMAAYGKGDRDGARAWLDHADENALSGVRKPDWSFWRYRNVDLDLFLADNDEFRQLIQGLSNNGTFPRPYILERRSEPAPGVTSA